MNETVRELHNEALQKGQKLNVQLLKDPEIQTDYRLALIFQLHQELYDEENHLRCPLAGCKAAFTYQQVLGIRKQQQMEWLSAVTTQKTETQQKKKGSNETNSHA